MFTRPQNVLNATPAPDIATESLPRASRTAELALVIFFLAVVSSGVLVQTTIELRRGGGVRALEVFRQTPTAANLRSYEHNLEDASVVARALRPWVQFAQFAWLGDGGEKALVGRDNWLFYKPGYDDTLARVRSPNLATNDPLTAIVKFRNELTARGIHLLVVPVPNKESIYPDRLTGRVPAGSSLMSPAAQGLLARLRSEGVEFVDLFRVFAQARTNEAAPGHSALYLAQDSHWSPAGIALAARAVSKRLLERGWAKPGTTTYDLRPTPVERVGDVLRMLQVPLLERCAAPESVACVQVVGSGNAPVYQDDPNSTILVLGDSFLRIYQQDEPGSAGFIAHLAKELKQPLTSLISDGGASTLVRQELNRRAALLNNKRVVVWEFVERDIDLGIEGWQQVPMPAVAQRLKVSLSWGHETKTARPFQIRLLTNDLSLTDLKPVGFEPGDSLRDGVAETHAGAGDVDGLDFTLWFPERKVRDIRNLQQIWAYLLAHSDADTVRRLQLDPGFRPDSRKLTIQMNAEGTGGFSVTLDQLATNKTFWIPELDMFLSSGDNPVSFAEHQEQLRARSGERVLHQIEREPEATYEQYTSRWEDMGNPSYLNPASVPPGHIVCLTWDSAIPKFGIDRGGNVWNDYGNPDHFSLSFDFGDLAQNLAGPWKGQRLAKGLPVVTTTIERDGVRYEVEQFAYPLHGPPSERRGDIEMVLLQKVRLTELLGVDKTISLGMTQRRELAAGASVLARTNDTTLLWEESGSSRVLLALAGPGLAVQSSSLHGATWQTNRILLALALPANGTREFIVKLPSPAVTAAERETFLALDYAAARAATLGFWSACLARGAQFVAPEDAVNDLFRVNLWHALCLPRRHGGPGRNVKIDLPYSNFAYDQVGTPWPVNQSIYVDYMLYDLRGYHDVAEDELVAMYRNNQEPNGHISGFANWGVYTPSMIYAVAEHFLLSGDRASLDRLLPQTLKALEWCLGEMKNASGRNGATSGLVLAPLNDLSHELKAWSFNQAYLYAGTELMGQVLEKIQHPRAGECREAARAMQESIQRGFARAAMLAPLVQLRDNTWIPYVPSDALTPRRLLDIWYPTDVDCGALHMSRLKALSPTGPLTTYLLNDHEDNLFLKQWGMANEPVYNQHATAYLLRNDVKPAIRAFYSMMACAFSHSTFEPVEHRWSWGQYFGPPSTDGAWFDLYRHMLIHERDDGSLLLLQAAPRKWLENGKQILVERAPSYYGPLNIMVASHAAAGEISASVHFAEHKPPAALLVRLRHPQGKSMRTVSVNGKGWMDFDPVQEWVRVPHPDENRYEVVARY